MWNKLTLREKADYMKALVKRGITDIDSMKEILNTYANGGELDSKNPPKSGISVWDSTEEIIDKTSKIFTKKYVDNVLWGMENPYNRGRVEGTDMYGVYTDKTIDNRVINNLGPGLASTGNHKDSRGNRLDYSKKYSRKELNQIAYNYLLPQVKKAGKQLVDIYGKDIWRNLTDGDIGVIIDNAYNVGSSNNANMPSKFPKMIKAMINKNVEEANDNMYTGSYIRQNLRMQLKRKGLKDKVEFNYQEADNFRRKKLEEKRKKK